MGKEQTRPEDQPVNPVKNDTPAGKVKMISNGIIRFIPKNRVDEYKKLGYVPV